MVEDKKIQKMRLDAELLAAGVKVDELKKERDVENGEKLANICLTLSIFGILGDFLGKLIAVGGNRTQTLMGGIWFSIFPIMSTVAIVLSFWGIIVMYSYHKKYGLTNNRQTLELFLALALGILNFFV